MIWPTDAQLARDGPLVLEAAAFMLVGGWRWINTDKHYGPWHRWLLLAIGGTFVLTLVHLVS